MTHRLRSFLVAIALCAIATAFCVSSQGADADRPNDPNKSSQTAAKFLPLGVADYSHVTGFVEKAELPTTQPIVRWRVVSQSQNGNGKVEAIGLSDVVVADGMLYFGDDRGNLVALNVETQTEKWSHEHGHRISMTPSVDHDQVYFGSERGITALRRETGDVVWTFFIEL